MLPNDTFNQRPLWGFTNSRVKHKHLLYAFDWVFMLAAAAVGGCLWTLVPVRQHLFRLDDPVLAYPVLPDLVSVPMLLAFVFGIPLLIMSFISIVVTRSPHDFHHAVLGLFQSLAVSLLLVSIVKVFLGGLRPNFLARCFAPTGIPDPAVLANATRYGFDGTYYDTSICSGNRLDVNDAQAAFPSGHSALAGAGLTYLSLYLNGKFKTFQHRGHLWIYTVVTAAMFGSFIIGFSRIVDYHHTPYNVAMGLTIGFFIAFSMYRLNYLSLFGPHNHVPVADHWYHRSQQLQQQQQRQQYDRDIERQQIQEETPILPHVIQSK